MKITRTDDGLIIDMDAAEASCLELLCSTNPTSLICRCPYLDLNDTNLVAIRSFGGALWEGLHTAPYTEFDLLAVGRKKEVTE